MQQQEVGTKMISSFCHWDEPQCINVEFDEDGISINNTDTPFKHVFATRDEWDAFIKGVKAGEFDLVPA